MMAAGWLVPPLAVLAGWVIWSRLPAGADERDDPLERGFAALICGLLLAGFAALLLAEAGGLQPLTLAAVLSAAAGFAWRFPAPRRPAERLSRADAAVLAAVTLAAAATGLPASENLLGGRDPGVYANTAAWLAREGTLVMRSEALASMASHEPGLFFGRGAYLPGFSRAEPLGVLFPQFLHLFPVYMALGHWAGGHAGAFAVPPVLGVLASLSVFFFARRLLGTRSAALAAALLVLNLAQVYAVRNPFSEGLTQLSVFTALWCIGRAQATGGVRWGLLGGMALGAALLTRIDAALVALALTPALAIAQIADGPRRWLTHAFVPAALVLGVWSVAHGWFFSRPYVRNLASMAVPLWVATLLALAASSAALAARRRPALVVAFVHRHGRAIWALTGAALGAAFVFALWIRPHLEPFAVFQRRGTRTWHEQTLVRVAWYTTVPLLIAALGGVIAALRRWLVDRQTAWLPLLSVLIACALLYFRAPHAYGDHPWMMRRYVPVILPGAMVAAAAGASWLWRTSGTWRWPARTVAALVIGFALAHEVRMLGPFWTLREQEGAIRQVAAFAERVPAHAMLLVEQPGIEARLATPLAFIWQRHVLPVLRRPGEAEPQATERRLRFEAQVRRWRRDGRDVLYLVSAAREGQSLFVTPEIRWVPRADLTLSMTYFGDSDRSPPRQPRTSTEAYIIYQADASRAGAPCVPSTITAASPMLGVAQGFHHLNHAEREAFRWTEPAARLVFPSCNRRGSGRPARLRVRGACWRDPAVADCSVAVTVNGVDAGRIRLTRAAADHDLAVPAQAVAEEGGPVEVRFSGPAFVPAQTGLGTDERLLSFQFHGASLAR